jgi:hypothetical protein
MSAKDAGLEVASRAVQVPLPPPHYHPATSSQAIQDREHQTMNCVICANIVDNDLFCINLVGEEHVSIVGYSYLFVMEIIFDPV